MKKILVSMFLSFVSAIGLFAQDDNYPIKGDFNFLMKIGLNGALLIGEDIHAEDVERVPALSMGANIDYYFSSVWSFRTGLIYEQRNFEVSYLQSRQESSYLVIPVTANLHIGKNKRWNINLGPSFGFNLTGEIEGFDESTQISSTDFGIELGTGFKVPLSGPFMYFEINSFAGFNNPIENSDISASWSRVSLNVGIVF